MTNRLSAPAIFVQSFIFCTVIAVILWKFVPSVGQYGFFSNLVHAQAIGNCICLLAIAITRLAQKFGISSRGSDFLYIFLAIPTGTVLGMSLAGWWLGFPVGPLDLLQDSEQLTISAVTAVIASIVFNWHLSNREKVVRLELEAAKERHRADRARLAMLQAQLEPHMLFNTLANLRALICSDTERATEMLDRLDNFLRATLSSSQNNSPSQTNTLQHEFKILDDYLALMQIRLGKRLLYQLVLPAACEQLQVPPLLLQPLVENAIRHGIEPSVDGGRIDVSAQHKGDYLTIVVADTGVGMCGEQLPPNVDQRATQNDKTLGGGLGLQNLKERLRHTFNGDAEIRFDTVNAGTDNTNTRITIKIPYSAAKPSA